MEPFFWRGDLLFLTPATLYAQSTAVPLSGLLPGVYRDVIAAEDKAFSSLSSTEQSDLQKARLGKVFQINNLSSSQLSSFPLGSSAGGFTWTFEPTWERMATMAASKSDRPGPPRTLSG